MPYRPIREHATATAAGNAKFLFVDVAALDQFIHTGHQVLVIIPGIVVLNYVPEILTVARAAARVGIEHHITLRRHPLKLMIENEAVSRMWTAMDVEDKWVFLFRIKIRWFLHPRLNAFAIKRLIPDLFGLGKVQAREEFIVEVR